MSLTLESSFTHAVAMPSLVGPEDPPPFVKIEGGDPVLLVSPHDGNYVPPHLGTLGLSPDTLNSHMAYDINIRAVRERVLEIMEKDKRVGIYSIHTDYSRLVSEANRTEAHFITERTDTGALIEGNIPPILTREGMYDRAAMHKWGNAQESWLAQVEQRLTELHRPFHQAVTDTIEGLYVNYELCIVIGLHSFTRDYNGRRRDMDMGILYLRNDNRKLAELCERSFKQIFPDIRYNEPYSMQEYEGIVAAYGEDQGAPTVCLEFCQDVIATPLQVEAVAQRLVHFIEEANRRGMGRRFDPDKNHKPRPATPPPGYNAGLIKG